MKEYDIVLRCNTDDTWQVEHDGKVVYTGDEFSCHTYAHNLEQRITGSDTWLYGNSRIRIKGYMDYLEDYSYEDFTWY